MNERIKELYSEAAVYAFDQRFIPGVVRELQEVITEKFSELIVKEMLDITDAHKKVFQTDQDRAFIEYIKQSVKQHFGVKE